MARVSFTLQKEDVNKGSYLRYDEAIAARPNYDSALKAEGFQLAPIDFQQSFFDVTSVCYGEVSLTWGVNIVTVLTAIPDVAGVVVVYSPNGEPQTVSAGHILVESSTDYSYEHQGVPEGKFAYYSLFVHYASTDGDDYYERAASMSVLLPTNYGSTLALWNRIPEFYRNQDQVLAEKQVLDGTYRPAPCAAPGLPDDVPLGPLFKYLSIIGYDMDRMRTILDYVMTAKDPSLASTESLDALAEQMGVTMSTADLGASRLRNVIDDIGFFRRSKGTLSSVEDYAEAIGISDFEIDQTTHSIRRYSQRVNYITVPKTATGIVQHRPAHQAEVLNPQPFAGSPYATPPRYTVTGTSFQSNNTGASAGVTHALIRINSPVPVKIGDSVGFSVHSGIGTDAIKWVRLVNDAGVQQAISHDMKRADGAPAFQVDFFR